MSKVQLRKPYIRTLIHGNLKYVLNGKTKTAGVLCLSTNSDEVTIPTFINYGTVKYTVTSILENAFQSSCCIKSVKFEKDSSLLAIGRRAFYRSKILHIDIPDSVQEICDKAFYECFCFQKRESINISNNSNLKKIGKKAFYGSSIGDRFYLPSSIEEIDDYAFAYCHNLTDIDIYPINLRIIGKSVFVGTYISFIRVPFGLEFINDNTFQVSGLRYIFLSDNVKTIGKAALAYTKIEKIFIPRKVEKIDDYAFKNSSLSKIEFAENSMLKTIGKSAFKNCKFYYIKIPSSCTIIGKKAFAKCKNLNFVDFENNSKLEIIDEFAFLETEISRFTIPPNLKETRKGWLKKCERLTKISCNQENNLFKTDEYGKNLFKKLSIEKVDFDTFALCVKHNIQKVEIPDSIEIIDSYAFESCKLLQSIEISKYSNLRVIGEGAFAFTKIESFTFPPKLEELKTGWCYGMNNLSKIDVNPQNPLFSSFDEGKVLLKKSSKYQNDFDILVFSSRNNENVILPSSIEIIEAYALDNCRNISRIEIPPDSKLRLINDFAFNNSSIKSISIPSTVTKIGNCAFFGSNLQEIQIKGNSQLHEIEDQAFAYTMIRRFISPPKLKKIGKFCFSMCKLLKSFVIPVDSEIEEVGEGSFKSTSIESFRIPVHLSVIESSTFALSCLRYIEFPENSELTTIGTAVFNNTNIEKLSIPSNVTQIEKLAFIDCPKLSRVEIPQNSKLTSIKKCAFKGTSIVSFHIPPHIKHLGKDIFQNCKKLEIVELDENTELMTFNVELFFGYFSPIIMIPSNLRNLPTRKKITIVKQ